MPRIKYGAKYLLTPSFSHEYDTPKDWEPEEINNVMNHSIVGWEKVSSHRFAGYGTQRGWCMDILNRQYASAIEAKDKTIAGLKEQISALKR